MATGQGGYYTSGLTIATIDQVDGDSLVPVDTQSPNGSSPQTLAMTLDQVMAGSFGIIAAAGATQGTATQITTSNVIVTVTASTQGVKLPTAATGKKVTVIVPGTVGVKVYPSTGDKISTGSTNAAVALGADNGNIYLAKDAVTWALLAGA